MLNASEQKKYSTIGVEKLRKHVSTQTLTFAMLSWDSTDTQDAYLPSSPGHTNVLPRKRAHSETEIKTEPGLQQMSLRPPARNAAQTAINLNKALVDDGAIADDVTSQEYITKLLSTSTEDELDKDGDSDGESTYSTGHSQVVDTLTLDEIRHLRELEFQMLKSQEEPKKIKNEETDLHQQGEHNQDLVMVNNDLRLQVAELRESQLELERKVADQKLTLKRVIEMLDPGHEKLSTIVQLRQQLKSTTQDLELCRSTLQSQGVELEELKRLRDHSATLAEELDVCRSRSEIQAQELVDLRLDANRQKAELDNHIQALRQHNLLRRMIGLVLWDIDDHPVERVLQDFEPLIQKMDANRDTK
ncbi:hypothetical protein F5880DRAFT_962910 [Lentinula raphanica]|nr:hypothetical protein F5880DRAFT_962910 [Lentinula raphanica]